MPIPIDAEREITATLQPDEAMVWTGKPIATRALWSGSAIGALGVGLGCIAVALYWTVGIVSYLHSPLSSKGPPSDATIAFDFFGVPFVIIGIIFLTMPYWAYRLALQTVYAVTNKRLMIVSGLRIRHILSLSPETISSIDRRARRDGSGDLIFNSTQETAPTNSATSRPVGFYGLNNVLDVESTIRATFPELLG